MAVGSVKNYKKDSLPSLYLFNRVPSGSTLFRSRYDRGQFPNRQWHAQLTPTPCSQLSAMKLSLSPVASPSNFGPSCGKQRFGVPVVYCHSANAIELACPPVFGDLVKGLGWISNRNIYLQTVLDRLLIWSAVGFLCSTKRMIIKLILIRLSSIHIIKGTYLLQNDFLDPCEYIFSSNLQQITGQTI